MIKTATSTKLIKKLPIEYSKKHSKVALWIRGNLGDGHPNHSTSTISRMDHLLRKQIPSLIWWSLVLLFHPRNNSVKSRKHAAYAGKKTRQVMTQWLIHFEFGFLLKVQKTPKQNIYKGVCYIYPGRLTWNLRITHLERRTIFQTSMIMFHLNLQGCIPLWASVEMVI